MQNYNNQFKHIIFISALTISTFAHASLDLKKACYTSLESLKTTAELTAAVDQADLVLKNLIILSNLRGSQRVNAMDPLINQLGIDKLGEKSFGAQWGELSEETRAQYTKTVGAVAINPIFSAFNKGQTDVNEALEYLKIKRKSDPEQILTYKIISARENKSKNIVVTALAGDAVFCSKEYAQSDMAKAFGSRPEDGLINLVMAKDDLGEAVVKDISKAENKISSVITAKISEARSVIRSLAGKSFEEKIKILTQKYSHLTK